MTIENAERISKYVRPGKMHPFEKFEVFFYSFNYVVLKNPDNLLFTYIVDGVVYREEIKVYPLFSLEEIKEALLMLNFKSKKNE